MGTMPVLSRRTFAFGSASVAGGVGLGPYSRAQETLVSPTVANLSPDSVALNPWVEISPERSPSLPSMLTSGRAGVRSSR
jgi:isoquinoline 1-oxidoreductase beta subunit